MMNKGKRKNVLKLERIRKFAIAMAKKARLYNLCRFGAGLGPGGNKEKSCWLLAGENWVLLNGLPRKRQVS
jgi:hypothetical protein